MLGRFDALLFAAVRHPAMLVYLDQAQSIGPDSPAAQRAAARNPQRTYEKQVEMPDTQKVRMFGKDTAVVTALLWLKGRNSGDGKDFDYKLWFSDTYVRTKDGWRYAFGQASLRLP